VLRAGYRALLLPYSLRSVPPHTGRPMIARERLQHLIVWAVLSAVFATLALRPANFFRITVVAAANISLLLCLGMPTLHRALLGASASATPPTTENPKAISWRVIAIVAFCMAFVDGARLAALLVAVSFAIRRNAAAEAFTEALLL